MPPYIFDDHDDDLYNPPPFLHPGIGRTFFKEKLYQPHVYQQSVTITATMWNEDESTWSDWKFGNWGILGEYSPLFVGLICGFGIVLIVVTSLMLWRYCLVSATKKVCCRGTYGVASCQLDKNSLSTIRREKKESLNGFENFNQIDIHSGRGKLPGLQRSVTVGSIPLNMTSASVIDLNMKLSKLRDADLPNHSSLLPPADPSQVEPLMTRDAYTSHLYLQKLNLEPEDCSKSLSRSTPDLEELYAKVNFSKKKKNRMRKGDAAIIAMSKSHSGHEDNSLDQTCSAIVVYNERTAL